VGSYANEKRRLLIVLRYLASFGNFGDQPRSCGGFVFAIRMLIASTETIDLSTMIPQHHYAG
jgi:hypothetical protein